MDFEITDKIESKDREAALLHKGSVKHGRKNACFDSSLPLL